MVPPANRLFQGIPKEEIEKFPHLFREADYSAGRLYGERRRLIVLIVALLVVKRLMANLTACSGYVECVTSRARPRIYDGVRGDSQRAGSSKRRIRSVCAFLCEIGGLPTDPWHFRLPLGGTFWVPAEARVKLMGA